MGVTDLVEARASLHEAVLGWARSESRDLPWRRTRDPWAILVSELMLQQTQVPRVVPRWQAFLERFPDPTSCADAGAAAVIEAWRGLGYNRRAVALHAAAVAIRDEHGGVLPDDLTALLALPGIGPYTARAVLVFAHERDIGVVDTNVSRLFARWSSTAGLTPVRRQELADALVPPGRAWAWTQALFDLGSGVCRPRGPGCGHCPVQGACRWRGEGPDPWRPDTTQTRFAGSDRQGRGRLVDALRQGPVPVDRLATVMGWPGDPDRARRVAATVVADGLAVVDADAAAFVLPPTIAPGGSGSTSPPA